jgi:hypothetical protein
MRLLIALTALGLAAAPAAFAQGVETQSALPVIKDGQCYNTAAETTPAEDQSKCREALGMQGGQDNTTTGSTTPLPSPPTPTPNPQ